MRNDLRPFIPPVPVARTIRKKGTCIELLPPDRPLKIEELEDPWRERGKYPRQFIHVVQEFFILNLVKKKPSGKTFADGIVR